MELTTRVHRTWLCSVVFMDIVGYSKHPVSWQLEIKKQFNGSVSEAIERMPSDERLILDTGDGAALCFFGDPEQALYCAIRLRDRFSAGADWAENRVQVRFGINLGPVKLIRDVNAQLNAIGDGINDGQRVMAFAEPDQILISRSFYDVVERLSDDNHRLFQYLGTRDDKHRRSHAVYAVIPPGGSGDGMSADAIFDVVSGTANEDVIYKTVNLDDGSVPRVDYAPVTEPPAVHAPLWDPAMLDAITRQLAQYAGPLARIMVSRESKHTADFDELYGRLAERLPAEKDKARFLATKSAFVVVTHEPGPIADHHPRTADAEHHADTGVSTGPPLTKETIDAARAKLVRYVGPIAAVMVTRAARAAANEPDFYLKLANFIESEADKTEFLMELGVAAQKVGLESL
jgi:class 3 adenylate cyclase